MNRLRGSVDRDRAGKVAARLAGQGVESGAQFWKGYRDASRELGLMIRSNGLMLALAIAMDRAKLADGDFEAADAASERSGKARALIDLAQLMRPDPAPGSAQGLREMIEAQTTLGSAAYTAAIDAALGILLWQKTLAAPLAPRDEKKGDAEKTEDEPTDAVAGKAP